MEDRQVGRLSGGRDQEIRHLATTLMLGGEQPLNFLGSANVRRGGFEEFVSAETLGETIPLGSVAGTEAELQITDRRTAELVWSELQSAKRISDNWIAD